MVLKYALPWRQWGEDETVFYRMCNKGNLVAYFKLREYASDYIIFPLEPGNNHVSATSDSFVTDEIEVAKKRCDDRLVELGFKIIDDRLINFE